uniref:DUF3715 domain-containing protein n=1 Tax=Heterorhabditis bacteriophora TaxID=37862 RepID=A0A1I7XDP3_HETBA
MPLYNRNLDINTPYAALSRFIFDSRGGIALLGGSSGPWLEPKAKFTNIAEDSPIFKSEIEEVVKNSLFEPRSAQFLRIINASRITNKFLEFKFDQFKKKIKSKGQPDQEHFGFLLIGFDQNDIDHIATHGYSVSTSFRGDLGQASQGVYVYKNADLVSPAPFYTSEAQRIMIFRTARGRSHVVGIDSADLDPTDQCSSHITSGSTSFPNRLMSFRYSAVYHYELNSDLNALDVPSGVLPYAVVDLTINFPEDFSLKSLPPSLSHFNFDLTLYDVYHGPLVIGKDHFEDAFLFTIFDDSCKPIGLDYSLVLSKLLKWEDALDIKGVTELLDVDFWGRLTTEREILIKLAFGYTLDTTIYLLIPSGEFASLLGLPWLSEPSLHCLCIQNNPMFSMTEDDLLFNDSEICSRIPYGTELLDAEDPELCDSLAQLYSEIVVNQPPPTKSSYVQENDPLLSVRVPGASPEQRSPDELQPDDQEMDIDNEQQQASFSPPRSIMDSSLPLAPIRAISETAKASFSVGILKRRAEGDASIGPRFGSIRPPPPPGQMNENNSFQRSKDDRYPRKILQDALILESLALKSNVTESSNPPNGIVPSSSDIQISKPKTNDLFKGVFSTISKGGAVDTDLTVPALDAISPESIQSVSSKDPRLQKKIGAVIKNSIIRALPLPVMNRHNGGVDTGVLICDDNMEIDDGSEDLASSPKNDSEEEDLGLGEEAEFIDQHDEDYDKRFRIADVDSVQPSSSMNRADEQKNTTLDEVTVIHKSNTIEDERETTKEGDCEFKIGKERVTLNDENRNYDSDSSDGSVSELIRNITKKVNSKDTKEIPLPMDAPASPPRESSNKLPENVQRTIALLRSSPVTSTSNEGFPFSGEDVDLRFQMQDAGRIRKSRFDLPPPEIAQHMISIPKAVPPTPIGFVGHVPAPLSKDSDISFSKGDVDLRTLTNHSHNRKIQPVKRNQETDKGKRKEEKDKDMRDRGRYGRDRDHRKEKMRDPEKNRRWDKADDLIPKSPQMPTLPPGTLPVPAPVIAQALALDKPDSTKLIKATAKMGARSRCSLIFCTKMLQSQRDKQHNEAVAAADRGNISSMSLRANRMSQQMNEVTDQGHSFPNLQRQTAGGNSCEMNYLNNGYKPHQYWHSNIGDSETTSQQNAYTTPHNSNAFGSAFGLSFGVLQQFLNHHHSPTTTIQPIKSTSHDMGETSNASPDAPASPDPEPVTIEAPASPDDLPQIPITEIQPQQIPWFPTDEGTEAHIQPVPLTQVDMSSGDTIRNVAKPSKKPLDHDRIANQSQDDEEEGEIHSDDDSGEDNSTMNNPNQPMPRDNELKTSEHFRPPKDRVDLRPPRSVRL